MNKKNMPLPVMNHDCGEEKKKSICYDPYTTHFSDILDCWTPHGLKVHHEAGVERYLCSEGNTN